MGGDRFDEVFTQASAIKIPILWELYSQAEEGLLALHETLPVSLASGVGGCGVLQQFTPGASRIALGDLAVLMIVLSDNVATNLLIDRLGMQRINDRLASVGLEQTRLRRVMIDFAARAAGRENTATPAEAVRLMTLLDQRCRAGDAAAQAVIGMLTLKKESPVTKALHGREPSLVLASKPGMLDGLRTEWALVRCNGCAYVFALMAEGTDDTLLQKLFSEATVMIHSALAGRAAD
ncbi:hypothetical protein Pla111_06040 [Botrimarina hoheduenensis]|uniref:beta-lactamase n=2 Tax=Botrimarina hoheduenensis TaxID=2528000 RepID=A0A5C5WD15_9BACT|nr:hypothetical protein Pla111_06040 [Botrimarina hoheduenensis]